MMMHIKMQGLLALLLLCGAPMVRASDENIFETLGDAESCFKQSEYRLAKAIYSGALASPSLKAVDAQKVNDAKINYGETLMALGEFEEGFEYFEARLQNDESKRKPLKKEWKGEKCDTLLVRYEHGIGDTVFFMPYMKQLNAAGIAIILRERGNFLKTVFGRQSYIEKVIVSDAEENAISYDYDTYAMGLPRYVSNNGLSPLKTKADICYSGGSIEPNPDLVKKWRPQFDKQIYNVVIGAYRASAHLAGECRRLKRDCAIAELIKHIAMPGVKLYHPCGGDHKPIKRSDYNTRMAANSLGKLDKDDVVEDADWDKITLFDGDFDKASGAFEDTLAVMSCADCVVSVDTSTAMFAGTLGAHVSKFFVLLPKESDWRWGDGQPARTPFFKNAKLFWQKEQGDWSVPLRALGEKIKSARAGKTLEEKLHAGE